MTCSVGKPPETAPGEVVYAVGDIHGRLDLLDVCLAALAEAAAAARDAQKHMVVIFLGDYVDRGPDSRGVIDRLMSFDQSGLCETRFLRGNHEQVMLDIHDGADHCAQWLKHGGMATLASYSPVAPLLQKASDAKSLVRKIVPPSHIDFLRSTSLTAQSGDYVFVHAGLRPDRLLEEQATEDILWLRRHRDDAPVHGHTVVHGHSTNPVPVLGRHRIGIDTEAHASGALSMVRLEAGLQELLRIGLPSDGASGVSVWPATDSAYRASRRGHEPTPAAPEAPGATGGGGREGSLLSVAVRRALSTANAALGRRAPLPEAVRSQRV